MQARIPEERSGEIVFVHTVPPVNVMSSETSPPSPPEDELGKSPTIAEAGSIP
jgi:hypothetical protein